MTDRLDKIYTRNGDAGTTRLATGEEVHKTHPRVEALGDIDELNCLIGVVEASLGAGDELAPVLRRIQNDLFDLGGEIAIADKGYQAVEQSMIDELEQVLDGYNAALPPLKEFILPGGTVEAARMHLARSICRRAERRLVGLALDSYVHPQAIAYLNRLSDLLFVLARVLSRRDGEEEVCWQPRKRLQKES
jgi:cob(I)alamin adenosyltransferase